MSMVPIGVLAGALLYLHWRAQEHERERSQIESVRLLAAAVDNTLDSSVERLSIFARLWSSSSLSEKAIYEQARNLLVNADTYTRAGGRIRVRIGREGSQAVLEIEDDGQGIAPENLRRVFDLFFQAESTADRAAGGLGIGLTLVQRIVNLHGGDVTATSAGRGRGATFTVLLPAIPAPAQAGSVPEPSGISASSRGVHARSG